MQIDPKTLPFSGRLYSNVLTEALKNVDDRASGRIQSIKTPWPGFNRAGINGLEWGTLLTIGARPGSGKTLIVSQILKEASALNPGQNFNILEFQFEMGAKQTGARAFAAETALDYNIVLSADRPLDSFSRDMMAKFVKEQADLERQGKYRIQINDPISNKSIVDAIEQYYTLLGGKPLIVTIDHSWLIKKDKDEKEKITTLYNTVELLMQVKKNLPIIIIMITQLNRSIDEPTRKTPGTIGNYPTSSDVFGGDALMQGSDMLIALNRPNKAGLPVYGPKQYRCDTDDIYMHLLKVRNGSNDEDMLFMNADFARQRLIEVPPIHCGNPNGAAAPGTGKNSRRSQSGGKPTFTTAVGDVVNKDYEV